jgi:hypothetical protein
VGAPRAPRLTIDGRPILPKSDERGQQLLRAHVGKFAEQRLSLSRPVTGHKAGATIALSCSEALGKARWHFGEGEPGGPA